jgi:uncharacterized protein (UPF0276 family)
MRRAGIGLRAPHHRQVADLRPDVGFLEVHSENFLAPAARDFLAVLRRDTAISLHGVGLSLGSAGGIDRDHLSRIAALASAIEPDLISEHLSWSAAGGWFLNDLCPLPYTDEALSVVASNVDRAQQALGRRLLIENPSAYLRFRHDTLGEAQFLVELARRTGCGLLVDVNNLAVNRFNHGEDVAAWLDAVPADLVGEVHLAGHSVNEADGAQIAIDDHGSRVGDAVWLLYAEAIQRFGQVPTLIEWDSDIPALEVLVGEAAKADRVAVGRERLHAAAR